MIPILDWRYRLGKRQGADLECAASALFNPFRVDIACRSVSRGFTPGFAVGPLRGPDDIERDLAGANWGTTLKGSDRKAQGETLGTDDIVLR